jgi:hypothetical protein
MVIGIMESRFGLMFRNRDNLKKDQIEMPETVEFRFEDVFFIYQYGLLLLSFCCTVYPERSEWALLYTW